MAQSAEYIPGHSKSLEFSRRSFIAFCRLLPRFANSLISFPFVLLPDTVHASIE